MWVHPSSVEIGVELLNLESPCKISGERITESESLKILRDLFGRFPFFKDEEIEKKFE